MVAPEPTADRCSTRTCAYPSPCLNAGNCTNTTPPDITANEFSCSCPDSFFGVGCQNHDACSALQPCQNGGNCTVDLLSSRQFVCSCPAGTTGPSCEIILSSCVSSPCENGGTCRDDSSVAGGFNCLCLPGFSGGRCQVDIDDCETAPCQNGGTCLDGVNSYSCECPPGFSGEQCQSPLVFCSSDSCANNGSCVDEVAGFSCICQPGWTGAECQENLNECLNEVCENGATCVDRPGSFVCLCGSGFTGQTCGDVIDFCSSSPCSGNGVCSSTPSGPTCLCDPGFTGEFCDQDIDECLSNPCANGATCMHGINHFTCICPSDATGLLCDTPLNQCSTQPCLNDGTCLEDNLGSFQCLCRAGFTGAVCETRFDLCVDDPCLSGGTCSMSETGFECVCPTGWSGPRCQFSNSITAKLSSCGVEGATDIFSEILSTTDSVAFTSDSPAIVTQYSLAAESLYFSSWVWQEEGPSGTIFSLVDSSDPATLMSLVSDVEFSEVTLHYSMGTQQLSITNTPLTARRWHHISLSLSSSLLSLAIDGQMMFNRLISNLQLPTSFNLTVGGGGLQDQFLGIMRGAAVYDGAVDLSTVEECTLRCAAGDGYCLNDGTCYDQFTENYLCSCAYGYTGPFCQFQNSRISFEGRSGSANLPELTVPVTSVELDFKTTNTSGQIFSTSSPTFSTSVGVDGNQLLTIILHCDGQTQQQTLLSPASFEELSQWHSVTLTSSPTAVTISLDSSPPATLSLLNTTNCSTPSPSSLLLGGTADSPPITGCVRDVLLDSSPLNSPQLVLTDGTQFGCSRDTAQFFGQSFLRLPPFLSPTSQTISFSLNTRSSGGVVYYSHRLPSDATVVPIDFLALHLSLGRLSLSYNLGETTTVITAPVIVNDGGWHRVEVSLNGTMGVLTVDGVSQQETSPGPLNMLDTTASVLLGGVPLPNRVSSFTQYSNYDGCLVDLEQNGIPANLLNYTTSQNVRFGTCV